MAKGKKIKSPSVEVASPSMDKEWRARDDAHDLIRHAEIRKDKDRFSRAIALLKDAHEAFESPSEEAREHKKSVRSSGKKMSRSSGRK